MTTLNSCRFLEPNGFFLNATSYLSNMTVPGHWLERYCPTCPAASYNIILDGVDSRGVPYAVEYDCSDNAIFGNNYCLHYLSREPSGFDPVLLQQLVKTTTVDSASSLQPPPAARFAPIMTHPFPLPPTPQWA